MTPESKGSNKKLGVSDIVRKVIPFWMHISIVLIVVEIARRLVLFRSIPEYDLKDGMYFILLMILGIVCVLLATLADSVLNRLQGRLREQRLKDVAKKVSDMISLIGKDNELALAKLQLELENIRRNETLADRLESELDHLISQCIELRKAQAPTESTLVLLDRGYTILNEVTKLQKRNS